MMQMLPTASLTLWAGACCSMAVFAGLQPSELASVEVLGGSTRVPAVFKLVENVFGCVPSRTLNAKEVVCRGAALQCAMISPLIKVRVTHTLAAVGLVSSCLQVASSDL